MWQVFWRCSPLLSRVTFLRNSRRKPRLPSSPLPRLRLLVALPLLRFQVPRSPLQHRRQFPAAQRSSVPVALKPLAPAVQRSLSLPKGLFQVARRSQAPAAFRPLYLPKCPHRVRRLRCLAPKGCRAARNSIPLSPVPIRLWLLSPILRWLIRPRQPIRRS